MSVLRNLALAGLVRRHGAVGEDEPRDAKGGEVVHDVLHPRVVGVAGRAGRRTSTAYRRAAARRPSPRR